MRPVSGNGRRSFFAETFLLPNLYNANKLPDLYLVILSQPVLNIHMLSCCPAGAEEKGCKLRGAGVWWELGAGRDSAAFLQFFGLLPFSAFLPLPVFACPFLYLILSCLARFLPCISCPLFVPACWDCLQLPPASFSCLTL